jgi:hypothetical protein
MGITHAKTSAKSDGSDATQVQPSDWNAEHAVDAISVTGLTGATAASRYVGATETGFPISGTFAVGDFVIDHAGRMWICNTAGSPGVWSVSNPMLDRGDIIIGDGVAANRALVSLGASATTSGNWGGLSPANNLIDGNDGSAGSQGNLATGVIWTVDLGAAFVCSKFRIKQDTFTYAGVSAFDIHYSLDGSNWSFLQRPSLTSTDQTITFSSVTARYFRISNPYVAGGISGWYGWTVQTIEVWGMSLADAGSMARLAVGSDGQVLTSDSAQTYGIKWAPPDDPVPAISAAARITAYQNFR